MQLEIGKVYRFNNEQSNLNRLLVVGTYRSGYDIILIEEHGFSYGIQHLDFRGGFPGVIVNVQIENLNIYDSMTRKMIGNNLRPYYPDYNVMPITPTMPSLIFNMVPTALEANPTIETGTFLIVGYSGSGKETSVIGKVTSNGLSTTQGTFQVSFGVRNNKYVIPYLADRQTTGIYIAYEDEMEFISEVPEEYTLNERNYPENNRKLPEEFKVGSTIAGFDVYSAGEVRFKIVNINTAKKEYSVEVLNDFNYSQGTPEFKTGQVLSAILDQHNTLYNMLYDEYSSSPEPQEIGFRMRVI